MHIFPITFLKSIAVYSALEHLATLVDHGLGALK